MTKEDEISGTAILVKGFWSYSQFYEGPQLPVEVQTKWIIFAGRGEPFLGDYVDLYSDIPLSALANQATIKNAQKHQNDLAVYRRKLLKGLEIYDDIESDDDIALWSMEYKSDKNSTTPSLLHTNSEEYYEDYLVKYRLEEGAFVEGSRGERDNAAFAIVDLIETRATIIRKDGFYSVIRKPFGEHLTTKKGKI